MLIKFNCTLTAHRSGILGHYDYHVSIGPLEGTNNKIKPIKRQVHGFKDHEFFKLKIVAVYTKK